MLTWWIKRTRSLIERRIQIDSRSFGELKRIIGKIIWE